MRVIVVRHGETIQNTKGILMGHLQGKLSARGLQQAKSLAKRLKNMKIDIIYSSDLKRAKETTREIVIYHKAQVIYTEELREQNYGEFQGKSLKSLTAAGKPHDFRSSGGESFTDLRRRIGKFLNRLINDRALQNKTILISAHAGVAWSTISILKKMPMRYAVTLKPKNTGILVFDIRGKRTIRVKDEMFVHERNRLEGAEKTRKESDG